MAEEFVDFSLGEEIARLSLARPNKRNALSRQFLRELLGAVRKVQESAAARLLVMEAQGPAFCAGMDLEEMQARAQQPDAEEQWRQDTQLYRELIETLFRLPLPTLAVVQGPVLAGGVGLVAACDIVLAAQSAWFALPEPKRGITAAVVTPLLAYRVGAGNAGYVLLSGERLSAEAAQKMGLCHIVTADEALSPRRDELLSAILSGAPGALRLTKQTLQECTAGRLSVQWDVAMNVSAQARQTEEAREGLAAFLQRRRPGWQAPPSP